RGALAKDPGVRQALVRGLIVVGDAEWANRRHAEAGAAYEESTREAELLIKQPTNPDRLFAAEGAFLAYARYHAALGSREAARHWQGRIVQLWSAWDSPSEFVDRKRAQAAARVASGAKP